jgi:hypothetical protein
VLDCNHGAAGDGDDRQGNAASRVTRLADPITVAFIEPTMPILSDLRHAASRLTTRERIFVGTTGGILVPSFYLACFEFSRSGWTLGVLNTLAPVLPIWGAVRIIRRAQRRSLGGLDGGC